MSQTKYTAKATTIAWTGTTPVLAKTQIEAKSKSFNVDKKSKEIDVTTQEDAVLNATAYLSGPSEATGKLSFLGTTVTATSLENVFHIGDLGTLEIHPQGTGSGLPSDSYANCVVTAIKIDYPMNGEGAVAGEIDFRMGVLTSTSQT